jgi:hypothetical protein
MNINLIDIPFEEVKKITIGDLKQLSQYEITPVDEYKTGKPKRLSPKNCYIKAFQYVSDKSHIEGIRLAHGLYKPSFINNHSGHAWVELPNEIVFDGVLQRFYKKEGYYNFYQITKQVEYDSKEMRKAGLEAGGTYGPWHE